MEGSLAFGVSAVCETFFRHPDTIRPNTTLDLSSTLEQAKVD